MTNIDAIVSTGHYHTQIRVLRHDIDWSDGYATFADEFVDTDDVPSTNLSGDTYSQHVLNSSPVHYYRLGETGHIKTANDTGSSPQNGLYDKYADDAGVTTYGAVYTDSDKSKYLRDNSRMVVSAFHMGTAGAVTAFSLEFFIKLTGDGNDRDGYMVWKTSGEHYGFNVTQQDSKLRFGKYDSTETPNIELGGYRLTKNSWTHVVFTVTADGQAVSYVNGQVAATAKFLRGIRVPNTDTQLIVGNDPKFGNTVKTGMDEVAMFTRVLSPSEVYEHYQRSVLNQGYGSQLYDLVTPVSTGSNTITPVTPLDVASTLLVGQNAVLTNGTFASPENVTVSAYDSYTGIITLTANVSVSGHTGIAFVRPVGLLQATNAQYSRTYIAPPSLINQEDVTKYVLLDDSLTLNRTEQQMVTGAGITLIEGWGQQTLKDKFKACTYLKIQKRYFVPMRGMDTGWFDVAHLITDGPVQTSVDMSGAKAYSCSCKGILKFLTLDLVNYNNRPDVIKVPRQQAVQTYQDSYVTVFRIRRAGSSTDFYYNWADKPNVQIRASMLTTTSDIVHSTDILPIKSAGDSVQVVGGAGQVVIDTNALQDKVKYNGYGAPQRIELEFYRFATYEDVIRVPVHSAVSHTSYDSGVPTRATIYLNDSMGLFVTGESYDRRTIFIKSGSAAGTTFKIIRKYVDSTQPSAVALDVQTIDGYVPDLSTFPIAVTDVVQVTDANLLEDCLLKVLMRKGYQMSDPIKPLYVQINPPEVPIQLPYLDYTYEDNIKDLELVQQIIQFGPPNYYLEETPEGALRTVTTVQKTLT